MNRMLSNYFAINSNWMIPLSYCTIPVVMGWDCGTQNKHQILVFICKQFKVNNLYGEKKNKSKHTEIYPHSVVVFCPCTSCISLMMENFHMYSIRMTIFRFHRHFRFWHLMTHSCCVLCSVKCLLIICVYMCASLCVYGYRSPEIHNFHTNIKN